ncbi:MAG TPA: decaprenyl-phosphate phosphoribosyltransferase [Acidimicrobiales bacterium]|nr:decaprenyl-phosphate phosphoribosyltransferase [Acidimicrobiales bacterium]
MNAATKHEGPSGSPTAPAPTAVSTGAVVRGMVRIARPRQWIKNLLVFAAPGAAGVLTHRHAALLAIGAFGIFCLAASGTYFLNDTFDADADRSHPTKRLRPVAAGIVSVPLALGTGAVLLALAIGLAWWMAGWQLALVIGIYAGVATSYSIRLKHVPVIDLVCVSAGFVLRAIAGGVATGVALSDWFIIVACFGSLLVVTGKRSAEQQEHGLGAHRPILEEYPPTFLRSVRLLSAAVTVTAYCLWAFERSAQAPGHHHHPIWFQLSIIPVVIALLHLELRFERGQGAAPEELAMGDHMLQVLGLAWAVLFAVGVYA